MPKTVKIISHIENPSQSEIDAACRFAMTFGQSEGNANEITVTIRSPGHYMFPDGRGSIPRGGVKRRISSFMQERAGVDEDGNPRPRRERMGGDEDELPPARERIGGDEDELPPPSESSAPLRLRGGDCGDDQTGDNDPEMVDQTDGHEVPSAGVEEEAVDQTDGHEVPSAGVEEEAGDATTEAEESLDAQVGPGGHHLAYARQLANATPEVESDVARPAEIANASTAVEASRAGRLVRNLSRPYDACEVVARSVDMLELEDQFMDHDGTFLCWIETEMFLLLESFTHYQATHLAERHLSSDIDGIMRMQKSSLRYDDVDREDATDWLHRRLNKMIGTAHRGDRKVFDFNDRLEDKTIALYKKYTQKHMVANKYWKLPVCAIERQLEQATKVEVTYTVSARSTAMFRLDNGEAHRLENQCDDGTPIDENEYDDDLCVRWGPRPRKRRITDRGDPSIKMEVVMRYEVFVRSVRFIVRDDPPQEDYEA